MDGLVCMLADKLVPCMVPTYFLPSTVHLVPVVCWGSADHPALLVVLLNTFRYSRYLLVPERSAIHVVLHVDAQPRDMVQAYLQVISGDCSTVLLALPPACS